MDIDYNKYWSTKDIINNLGVSKDWIYQHIRPNITEEMNVPKELPCVCKAQNAIWYRKLFI